MSTEYPCKLCNLELKNDYESIQCDLCDKWNHINCVNVSKKNMENLRMILYHGTLRSAKMKCLFQKCQTMI